MRRCAAILVLFLLGGATAGAQKPPLLPESGVAALAGELSGETAKRNLEYLARLHRQRGSRAFRAAAEFIAGQARAYGLADVRIEEFPADGKVFYGTQKSRPAWDAEFAELWEMRREGEAWVPAVRLASWDAMPITLAEDSEAADVAAELVDVGEGTAESDYVGKDVRGKIVLAGAQPEAVARFAVDRFGAAGIVSYAQNRRTAWWGENENLIRWGHLDSFSPTRTFAFMVSLKTARALRQRLARGETLRLKATVRAGRHPGSYAIVTGVIPGADPQRREEEVVFSCHLDHQLPGANDNASGCATILEVARTLARLVREGKIAPPARTLRFVWPPEIEGTSALLNARPEVAARIRAAIHMDMVGGGPETKAIFHVTRGPASLPSFVNDLAEALGEFVNQQSAQYASTGRAAYPLVAPEGGKEALQADFAEFTMGSDHEVYTEGSWRIPAIYLNDWPDRYIHTNFDSPANIDATKLQRAAFIGAASGYFLARMGAEDIPALVQAVQTAAIRRMATTLQRMAQLPEQERSSFLEARLAGEAGVFDSIARFAPLGQAERKSAADFLSALRALVPGSLPEPSPAKGEGLLVFRRTPEIKGPMNGFSYSYLADRLGEERVGKLNLLRHQGLRGSGGQYAYEVLNFVDGKRTAQQIRDAVAAEFGPVPLDAVVEYLRSLETIGVVRHSP